MNNIPAFDNTNPEKEVKSSQMIEVVGDSLPELVQILRITLNLIKIAWQLQHSFGNTRTFVKKCDRGHSNISLRSPPVIFS
ncbi:hypothetical protein [Spirulina sp. 06S082]|uniref:hypothetical protein n=1 Tax=Spirulina sp. 06S082 TaxID=3110248 RepID=UPI002B1F3BF0|nr:hypothetical protein [Spirulina sp. 06S082]MEA5468659.1 hypothetical protein [Spirulina sp. 06S082]